MISTTTDILEPGLWRADPYLERYTVPPCGSATFELFAGDAITVTDPEGAQPGELIAFSTDGRAAPGGLCDTRPKAATGFQKILASSEPSAQQVADSLLWHHCDIAKLDLAAVTAFDAWRTAQNGKVPAQSTINNHNSAINRVLDLAELNGWTVKSLRPTLLNKGVKTHSRGSFSVEEYRVIYTALRTFHKQTPNEKSAATRETLRNYVLFLANTGVRHGTEALGLTWCHFEWYERDGERYLAVNVDGKTNKRTAIARDRVVDFLWRQAQLNSRISVADFNALIAAKLDEPVFTTRLSATVTVHNLNRAFNALLDELDLKTGADGRTRTLYSWRHFYATQDLERGVSTHALSRQLGNSTQMIDRHYSKYSPLLNAELHSGRKKKL